MRYHSIRLLGLFCLVGALGVPNGFCAEDTPPAAGPLAKVVVTVRARGHASHPAVSLADVMVYENSQRRPVVSWVPTQAEQRPLDLVILMDDSLNAGVGRQFGDLADFLRALPASTRVRVAYAANGMSNVVQDFTTDHQRAAQSLRLPRGDTAAGASIYQSVRGLLKRWPEDGNRRALLVVSDGLDINQGIEQSEPSQNTELQLAIELAQRTHVPIYTIFANGAALLDQNAFLQNNGQGCLFRLAKETGGQSFFQGTYTPLAFAPYLNQLAHDLRAQYLLTFRPLPGLEAGYQRLRVTTEVPDVELVVPPRVFIGKVG
jgi:VWFA-related protein